jgi:Uri superfamily endonuclease
MFFSIPSDFGSYALHLNLVEAQMMQVGSLGEFNFPAGDYIYLGSALGSGGLKARLGRHLRGDGHYHWHIDWLRASAAVIGYYYLEANFRLECVWSQALINCSGAGIPAPGFGASDCRASKNPCAAHLVWFKSGIYPESIRLELSMTSGSEVAYLEFTSDSQSGLEYIE